MISFANPSKEVWNMKHSHSQQNLDLSALRVCRSCMVETKIKRHGILDHLRYKRSQNRQKSFQNPKHHII